MNQLVEDSCLGVFGRQAEGQRERLGRLAVLRVQARKRVEILPVWAL